MSLPQPCSLSHILYQLWAWGCPAAVETRSLSKGTSRHDWGLEGEDGAWPFLSFMLLSIGKKSSVGINSQTLQSGAQGACPGHAPNSLGDCLLQGGTRGLNSPSRSVVSGGVGHYDNHDVRTPR